jgi:hypothetical protein
VGLFTEVERLLVVCTFRLLFFWNRSAKILEWTPLKIIEHTAPNGFAALPGNPLENRDYIAYVKEGYSYN